MENLKNKTNKDSNLSKCGICGKEIPEDADIHIIEETQVCDNPDCIKEQGDWAWDEGGCSSK